MPTTPPRRKPRPAQQSYAEPAVAPSQDDMAQAIARAIIATAQTSAAATYQPPSWLDEVLAALDPLRALAPIYGKLSVSAASDLKAIRGSLARVDMSNAAPPRYAPTPCPPPSRTGVRS